MSIGETPTVGEASINVVRHIMSDEEMSFCGRRRASGLRVGALTMIEKSAHVDASDDEVKRVLLEQG